MEEKYSLKEYFKGKIDWKFYNAILDRLMRYEDEEISCEIDIVLNTIIGNSYVVFKYKDSMGEYSEYIGDEDKYKNFIRRLDIDNGSFEFRVIIKEGWAAQEFLEEFNCEKYGYSNIEYTLIRLGYVKIAPNNQ